MSCKCARPTKGWSGWECTITERACMFLIPNAEGCKIEYDEGLNITKYDENCEFYQNGECVSDNCELCEPLL